MGGGSYKLLISAYKNAGLAAVIHLLNSEPVTPKVWANALTELAKELRKTDSKACADMAFLAWQLDPQPYRFKWYALRLYDAGEIVFADALIDLFPPNIDLKDQEKERIKRIKKDANHHYLENTSSNSHLPLYIAKLEEAAKRIENLIFENAALKRALFWISNLKSYFLTSFRTQAPVEPVSNLAAVLKTGFYGI